MAKRERTTATYRGVERRSRAKRGKIDPRAIPKCGDRRRGFGRRETDNVWNRASFEQSQR